jgi:hypothetical protein
MEFTYLVRSGLLTEKVKAWDFTIEHNGVLLFRNRAHNPLRAFRVWDEVERAK